MSTTLVEIIESIRPKRAKQQTYGRSYLKARRHTSRGYSSSEEEVPTNYMRWTSEDE